METCSIPGCTSAVVSRGWCSKHYTRWQRHGDPLVTSRTPPMPEGATVKFCPRCSKRKPLADFSLRPSGKPKGYCKECEADYQAQHAATVEGRELRRRARAKWNDENHEYFLSYRYGITKADYDRMREAQGDSCAICGDQQPGSRSRVWSVDHCHATNRVRGLLCHRCNMGLGYFKDDPERLRAAIKYLS